jgi:putative toxin-antitoxin system antitoxin component (TIGR02293 family)
MTKAVFDLLEMSSNKSGVESIRQGLSVAAADHLADTLAVPAAEFAHLLGISLRTLMRHRQSGQPLQPVVSDRLYRLARITALATEVFDDDVIVARAWLRRPNRVLAGAIPLELLDTDAGVEQVTQLLNRIEYEVYS